MRFSSGRYLAVLLVVASCALSCQKSNEDIHLALRFNPESVDCETTAVWLQVASNADWTLEIEEQPEWVRSISLTSGSGNKNSIAVSLRKNTSEAPRSVNVIARAGGLEKRTTLTQRGFVKEARMGWLELPEYKKDATHDFFFNTFKLDGRQVRNFSYYFDYSNQVSLWVAYPLNTALIGKGSRTDAWGVIDPNIPAEKQPLLANAYQDGNNGWYARGHQCPSADRYWDEANRQTFYGTNMTPQLNDRFNGTIWANLEKKVRDWAALSDTLYVVTGCVLDGNKYYVWDSPRKYNEMYGTNIQKKRITVPTGYYKAVIRRISNSTIGYYDESGKVRYMGLAVFLEHKEYSDSKLLKSYFMSIDKLEEKLGYDLFASLPDVVGEAAAAKIESEDPTSQGWWGIN